MNSSVRKFEFENVEYNVSAEKHEASVEFHIYENDNTDYLFSGYVKWDGCSNWDFQSFNKRVGCTHPLHFCDRKHAIEFGIFLGKLYDWAAELLPTSD